MVYMDTLWGCDRAGAGVQNLISLPLCIRVMAVGQRTNHCMGALFETRAFEDIRIMLGPIKPLINHGLGLLQTQKPYHR